VTARADAALHRLAGAAARRPVTALIVWGVLLVGLGAAAAMTGSVEMDGLAANGSSRPATPAQDALDRLDTRIPGAGDPTGWVVLIAPDGTTVDDRAFSATVGTLVGGLRETPGVTAVIDPGTGGTVSTDHRSAFVPVAITAQALGDVRSAVAALVAAARADGPVVEIGGVLAAPDPEVGPGSVAALAIGVVLAAVVAGLILGSTRGALLATGTALIGSGVGVAVAVPIAGPLGLTGPGAVIAFLLGLAVGAPSAVVLLGRDARPSMVVGGAMLVVVATAGLPAAGIGVSASVGAAAGIVVVASVTATLTLLPALERLTGGELSEPIRVGPGRWERLVAGHPAVAAGAATVALAAVLVPAVIVGDDRAGGPADRAEELLAAAFGAGAAGPLLLTVEVDDPADLATALPTVADRARKVEGVALAAPGRVASDGTLGVVTVLPTTGPADPATRDLVHRLREQSFAGDRAVVEVTGATAVAVDLADELSAALSRYLLVIGPIALALLAALVRPWTAGVAAAVGSAVSVAAVMLLLRALGGAGRVSGIDPMPILLTVGVLLGLLLDQAVRSAAGSGASGRARTVGGCAVLVAAWFGPLLVAGGPLLVAGGPVSAGVASAVVVGVLLDASVVRLTLLPAVVGLLGRRRPVADEPSGSVDATPAGVAVPPAGGHAARGVHSAEPGRDGRRVIEEAMASTEDRRGGRHRGD